MTRSLFSSVALVTALGVGALLPYEAQAQPTAMPPQSPSSDPTKLGHSDTDDKPAAPDGAKPKGSKDEPKHEDNPMGPARGPAPPDKTPKPELRTDLALAQKRPHQEYDPRPEKPSVAKGFLWVPRILLFPVYVVTDFVIRRPLGYLDMKIEQGDVINKVMNFFTFGPNNDVGLVPTALIDFGFRPSVGLFHFYNNFLFPKNNLLATVSTGGARYLKGSVADRLPIHVAKDGSVPTYVQLEVDAFVRPDLKFWGIGPSALRTDLGDYEERTVGTGARIHHEFFKGTFVENWVTVRHAAFADGKCVSETSFGVTPVGELCATTSLLEQVRLGRYAIPPGFKKGYSATKIGARVVLDSRPQRPLPGSGVAIDLRVEQGTVLSGETHGSWINYGGSLGGFVDLTGHRRVLGLIVDARFEDKLQSNFAIPFTELLGARKLDSIAEDEVLRGFLPGRLLGTSSISATLNYEWPIWAFLDGTIQAAVGNVYSDHLEDFKMERNRFSFVSGVTTPNHRDHQFNFLLGFGTKTFAQGGAPDSLRLLLGGTTGF